MNNIRDDEKREYNSHNASVPVECGPQPGAPAERTDAPVFSATQHAPTALDLKSRRSVQALVPRVKVKRRTSPDDDWREPAYSETHDTTSSMFTPGICVLRTGKERRKTESASPERNDRQKKYRLFFGAACLVLLCAVLSGAAAYGVMEYRIQRGDFPIINQVLLSGDGAEIPQHSVLTPTILPAGAEISAEDIYDLARSQVVGIRTGNVSARSFFGQHDPPTVNGSGFIISNDGYILTNFHVVEAAHTNDIPITVFLNDGEEYDASIVGFDSGNDVAVIKIEADWLNAAAIANSDDIRVGQRVYAIGNPFGTLVHTMTEGIISALDRVVTVDGKIIGAFQLSAAVNSGNSGGPVYDVNGEVIGIVTAKFMSSAVEGVGFAIPINDAIEIAESLIEHGYITGRPFIGITPQTVTSGNAEFFGWVEGVYVRSVMQDSAAEKAGLMFGDVIIKLGNADVKTREALELALRKYRAGDTTTITVWRVGEEIDLSITFDEAQPR